MRRKEQLLKQQEQLIREIKEQEEEKVNSARGKIDRKKEELSALAIRKVEIGHQVFYEKEIRSCKEEQAALQGEIKEDMLKKETCKPPYKKHHPRMGAGRTSIGTRNGFRSKRTVTPDRGG